MSVLEQERYTTESYSFIPAEIIEYDMREGGFNVSKAENLLPPEVLDELSKLDKKDRTIQIGKLHYKYPNLRKGLPEAFRKYRMLFGELNDLSDEDIIAVKKDAIFTKKVCYNTKIGEYVEFREKNVYSAFMKIPKTKGLSSDLEIFMSSTSMDIKGIQDDAVELHKDGILVFLRRFMTYLSQYDNDRALKYLIKTMNDYKQFKLPVEYYREFSQSSKYRLLSFGQEMEVDNVGEEFKKDLAIEYNYITILVPLLNMLV